MSENKAQMSTGKLSLLLGTLFIIWILCYNAEQSLPNRVALETYDRMPDPQITPEDIIFAQKLMSISNEKVTSDQKQMISVVEKTKIEKKYNLNEEELELCIVVASTQHGDFKKFVDSIERQSYSQWNVYFFDDHKKGVASYIESKNMQDKFQVIQNQNPNGIVKNIVHGGTTKCSSGSFVVPLLDSNQILGHLSLKTISTVLQEKKADVVWSGALNRKEELARSYSYPSEIIESQQYNKYPYIAGGLQAFKKEIFSRDLATLASEEKVFQVVKANKMLYGLTSLMKAELVQYLNDILLYDPDEEIYMTTDKKMKEQIETIRQFVLKNL